METAVNESLSDPKKTFDASCIQWICDENTIMKVYTQKNMNIREVPTPILSWNYFFNSQTFSETYGKENYRTFFADVGTLVNSWNDCFESEINNFKQNNYTIHGVGKYLIYLFYKRTSNIYLWRCIFQELSKFLLRKYFLYSQWQLL